MSRPEWQPIENSSVPPNDEAGEGLLTSVVVNKFVVRPLLLS